MRWLVAIVLLAPSLAAAQPGAMEPITVTHPDTYTLAAAAHTAGARGDCVGAAALARRVYQNDPAYYRAALATDPVVASCQQRAPRREAPVAVEAVDTSGTPPLSSGAVAGELLIGGLFTVGGVIGGAYIGYGLECSGGCGGEYEGLGGAILGAIVGAGLVTPLGVVLVGNSGDSEGSTGGAIGGSIVGTLVGLGIIGGAEESGVVLGLAMPVIGATIGFNMSRHYKVGRGRVSLAPVPMHMDHGVGLALASGSF